MKHFSPVDYGQINAGAINCITQDKRGIIYAGTREGILEFDGHDWRFIKAHLQVFVFSIDVSDSGTVYIGASSDIAYLKADREGELQYISLAYLIPEEAKPLGAIFYTICLEDKVYFLDDMGILIYDGQKIERVPSSTTFHTMFEAEGKIYVRQREVGVLRLEGKELVQLKGGKEFEIYGLFGVIPTDKYTILVTQEIGLYKLQNDSISILKSLDSVQLNRSGILGSQKLSSGNITLTTHNNGLLIIDADGQILQRIDLFSGLPSNNTRDIFEDQDHNLWITTSYGLSVVGYKSPLHTYGYDAFLEGRVNASAKYASELFVCTSVGLYAAEHYERSRRKFMLIEEVEGQCFDVEKINGKWYCYSEGGIYILSREQNRWVAFRISSAEFNNRFNEFLSLGRSTQVLLNCGENREMGQLFDLESKKYINLEMDNIPFNYAAEEPKPGKYQDEIWISTSTSVVRLVNENGNYFFKEFDAGDYRLGSETAPFVYNDRLYISSDDKVFKFQPNPGKKDPLDGKFKAVDLFGGDTLGKVSCFQAFKDDLWVIVRGRVRLIRNHEIVIPPFADQISRASDLFIDGPANILFISTEEGLVTFDLNYKEKAEGSYSCVIRSILDSDNELIYDGGFRSEKLEKMTFDLDYENNSIMVNVSAPYFSFSEKVYYSAILEGFDKNWSEWSENVSYTYSQIPEGDYVFRIKSKTSGELNAKESSFILHVNPPWFRSFGAYIIYVLFILTALLVVLNIIRNNRIIKSQKKEVEEQKVEIETAHEELEETHKEIKDSIAYAKRIQSAILPPARLVKEYLKESFILYKPKDVVAGDFYWMEPVDRKVIFAAADCTGHGVPGAMVSVICNGALNRSVREFGLVDPGQILDKAREIVIQEFEKSDEEVKDGMDIALCSLEGNKLHYAGAHNPLWIIRAGEIIETKANKQPIGKFDKLEPYNTHSIDLESGDTLYIFSDGYVDQFGGEKGKKFKSKAFRELLISIQSQNMEEQKISLDNAFEEWRGTYEQVDDVCVIGVRV